MYKIAVVGDRDSIYGFAAVGLIPFPVSEGETCGNIIKKLVESNEYAVIYVTEKCAQECEKEILYYNNRRFPAIILIPGVDGNTGKGIMQVKRSVEQAVGSDIIFNK